ncbi:MAG: GtrA family protein [Anaerolineaceae bacterium]|jgi:putative flippase GtrA
MNRKNKELVRFLRFAIVGAVGAVIDFGIFNLLTQITDIKAVWASVISFIAAVISNFIWNRYWTYPDSRSKPITQQMVQFIIISLVGLGIRAASFSALETILLQFFTQKLPQTFVFTPTFVAHNFTLAILILIVMIWNFLANRIWTYNDIS